MSWFSKKVKTLAAPLTTALPAPVAEKVNDALTVADDAVSHAVTEAVGLADNAVTSTQNAVSAAVTEAVKSPSRAVDILCAPIASLFCIPYQSVRKILTSDPPQAPQLPQVSQVPEPPVSTAQVEVVPESKLSVSGPEPVQEKTTQASSEELLNTRSQPTL
jgi:hypothetical protein